MPIVRTARYATDVSAVTSYTSPSFSLDGSTSIYVITQNSGVSATVTWNSLPFILLHHNNAGDFSVWVLRDPPAATAPVIVLYGGLNFGYVIIETAIGLLVTSVPQNATTVVESNGPPMSASITPAVNSHIYTFFTGSMASLPTGTPGTLISSLVDVAGNSLGTYSDFVLAGATYTFSGTPISGSWELLLLAITENRKTISLGGYTSYDLGRFDISYPNSPVPPEVEARMRAGDQRFLRQE